MHMCRRQGGRYLLVAPRSKRIHSPTEQRESPSTLSCSSISQLVTSGCLLNIYALACSNTMSHQYKGNTWHQIAAYRDISGKEQPQAILKGSGLTLCIENFSKATKTGYSGNEANAGPRPKHHVFTKCSLSFLEALSVGMSAGIITIIESS
jgi:hypothetical protein